jgi:L-fuconolactonase
MTIDAHFHCWQPARGDYGWLTPQLGAICRDVSVADWLAQAAPHGVVGGVLVQAAPTEAETRFLLHQAQQHAAVLGVVGWVDWLAPDAPQRVQALAQQPKLKGLRPMLQDLPDAAWILQPAVQPTLEAMADCALVFDALVKSDHLPHVLTLAQRHPALKIVIDHGAKPDIASGEWQPWADGMARIARETRALCKLSGLLTEAGAGTRAPGLKPWVDHLLACFGPKRLVWGSDWPVLELPSTYSDWHAITHTLLQALEQTDCDAVMGGNARRLYGLPPAVA